MGGYYSVAIMIGYRLRWSVSGTVDILLWSLDDDLAWNECWRMSTTVDGKLKVNLFK